MERAPEPLGMFAVLLTAPPQPPFPAELCGRPVAALSIAWSGDLAAGERVLAPLRAQCPPLLDLVGPMPYVALQSMLDETAPHGDHFYDRLHYLERVTDGLIDELITGFDSVPTPQAHIITGWMGGAVDRVHPGATAFGHRGAGAEVWFIGASGNEPVGPVADWVRRMFADTAKYATGGTYVNALADGSPIRDAYAADTFARLLAVKHRYDPDGVFSGNGIR
jgi:FAD/FMN-containing dehydrogenase